MILAGASMERRGDMLGVYPNSGQVYEIRVREEFDRPYHIDPLLDWQTHSQWSDWVTSNRCP